MEALNNRLDKIANIGKQKVDAAVAEQQRKEDTIARYAVEIKALAPRIEKLMQVGQALLKNDIPLGKQTKNICGSYDDEFVTNGLSHHLGFYFSHGKNNSPLLGIGIEGGGCCGRSLAVNEKGDMVVKIDPHYHSYQYFGYNDYCGKCKKFLDNFDSFEKRVYEYIDNL